MAKLGLMRTRRLMPFEHYKRFCRDSCATRAPPPMSHACDGPDMGRAVLQRCPSKKLAGAGRLSHWITTVERESVIPVAPRVAPHGGVFYSRAITAREQKSRSHLWAGSGLQLFRAVNAPRSLRHPEGERGLNTKIETSPSLPIFSRVWCGAAIRVPSAWCPPSHQFDLRQHCRPSLFTGHSDWKSVAIYPYI